MRDFMNIIWRAVMEERYVHRFTDKICETAGYQDEYEQSRHRAVICCPLCYCPVAPPYVHCPICGTTLNVTAMKTLRDNAFELAVFGWNYRTRYEKDIEKGKILDGKPSVQYQLYPPENWLIYLASLVLAGILGGLSYDAFKKIVSKMRGIFRSRFSREVPKEPELRKLYMYFTEYFLGMRDPKSPVFRAYSESLVQEATLSSTLETPSLKAISELMGDGAPTETITIPSEATPPSEDEVRAQLRRLVKERAKTELLVKRLQVYLQSLGSIKADE